MSLRQDCTPPTARRCWRRLGQLKQSGNTVFVVEHDLEVMRRADWIVDVGPDAGELGGRVLYSGVPEGLRKVADSRTAQYLFAERELPSPTASPDPSEWLKLERVTLNNLHELSVEIPIGLFTSITGVSGSGKSSLVSQALVELVAAALGHEPVEESSDEGVDLEAAVPGMSSGHIGSGMEFINRMVNVDQKPIGRTPRSNLATYTGLFDHVRRLFAATPARNPVGTMRGVSRSMCPRGVARRAKAKDL